MINAVIIKLPTIDLVVMVRIHLLEKALEVFLNHFPVKESCALELISDPGFEFISLENIIAVEIVLDEDVFNEAPAVSVHQNILDIIFGSMVLIQFKLIQL